jgi:hypothetical protein
MCTGVTSGFAGIKFSGSPKTQGPQKQIINKIKSAAKKPNTSLILKYGWNLSLSKFLFTPSGLFLPVWCKNIKCNTLMALIINGNKKCREKNRVRVGLSTAKPPHIQFTKSPPI